MAHTGGTPIFEGVPATALAVAHARAVETASPFPLFSDPYAEFFLAEARWSPPDRGDSAEPATSALRAIAIGHVVRTRFLDDFVLSACASGCTQVVLLGAGLDTRAFRLHWPPGTRLFELDVADMLAFKAKVLTDHGAVPACERVMLAADLAGEDWPSSLSAAGLRAGEPTVWIIEGLLTYFTQDHNDRLLTTLHDMSAPGSALALTLRARGDELDRQATLVDPGTRLSSVAGLWKSIAPADPARWLAGLGWHAEVFTHAGKAREFGRPIPTGTDGRPLASGYVISARRGD